jgi:hypothetical protein
MVAGCVVGGGVVLQPAMATAAKTRMTKFE